LSKALQKQLPTIILRTDSPGWERPEWYDPNVPTLNLAEVLKNVEHKERALYTLLSILSPAHIFNVNSRLAFETILKFGLQLSQISRIHCYYFCSDLDEQKRETGYPVHFFRQILPHITTSIFDSQYLLNKLQRRYSLSEQETCKLILLYSPCPLGAMTSSSQYLVDQQIARSNFRSRPKLLWAGRFDRQKRFDLLVAIAQAMPEVDFEAWGKAVLDPPPDLSSLPRNLLIHPPFKAYTELPLIDSDGWLYTSEWDGVPNILIEIGALGVPIVASDVGGVSELIHEETGWLVENCEEVVEYTKTIKKMLALAEIRRVKASALKDYVLSQHSQTMYGELVTQILCRKS